MEERLSSVQSEGVVAGSTPPKSSGGELGIGGGAEEAFGEQDRAGRGRKESPEVFVLQGSGSKEMDLF